MFINVKPILHSKDSAHLSLLRGGGDEEVLREWVLDNEGEEALFRFDFLLEQLKGKGKITYSVLHEGEPLFELIPMSADFRYERRDIGDQTRRLSRFSQLRCVEGVYVLETPLAGARVEIQSEKAFTFLHSMKSGVLPRDVELEALELLENAGVLEAEKEGEPPLQLWEQHDLLFHSRNRGGRHDNPIGAHYPFKETIGPLSAAKAMTGLKEIALFKPDIEALKREDLPFSYVLEERRSIREKRSKMTERELGEFLYRCARIKSINTTGEYESTSRPYPGGGAIYELEIYPIVTSVEGLSSGLYHYNAKDHCLTYLSEENEDMMQLVEGTSRAARKEEPAQVLFIITARFERMSWKYRSMVYSVILKNTGILMQTMYLVATAMNLSPCAIGAGDADLFAKVTGIDYFKESSVGEFILS